MLREYEVGDLKIFIGREELDRSEYEVKELKIEMKEGNHTSLKLVLEIKKELDKAYHINKFIQLEKRRGSGEISYNYQLLQIELGKTTYFTGYITSVNKSIENSDGIILKIGSTSKTIQLDRIKRYRAYQNTNMTYVELIEETLQKYGHDIIHLVNDNLQRRIGELVIQYDETDWAFLNRMLSKAGFGVYCGGYGEIILGHNKDEGRKRLCEEQFDEGEIVDERGNTAKELWSYGSYITGENLYIKGEDKGFVSQGTIECIGGRFKGRYMLRRKEYIYPYIGNVNIKGNSLECKVVSVPKDGVKEIAVMTVNFSEGLKKIAETRYREYHETESLDDYLGKNSNYYEFPYITPYSQTNTGFFCTPEIDDIVALYFPIEEEKSGYVHGAVNSNGNGRFSNPQKRNYTLTNEENNDKNFNFLLDIDKYSVYAANAIEQKAENKVQLESNGSFGIKSTDELLIYVEKMMKIHGEEQLSNFSKVHENVTEKKIEIIDVLEGNYTTELSIIARNKKLTVSETFLLAAQNVSHKI